MVRLKFALYALVALALVLGHLFLLSPTVSARAEAVALDQARAAAGAARAEALRTRADLLATGLALRTLPELQGILAAVPARGVSVATPAERLDLLQGLARGRLAPELRGRLVLGLVSEEGTALVRGSGKPSLPPKGVDLRALTSASTSGVVGRVYDAPHLFVSFPLVPAGGTLLLGLPLTGEALAQGAPASGGFGLALVSGSEPVATSVPVSAADAKGLFEKVKAGKPQVVRRGAASVLGPLSLPLASGEGGAPLLAAARAEVLPGLDGVGLVSLEPSMRALANYQHLALVAFLGLLGLTVVWMLLLGGGVELLEEAPMTELPGQAGEPSMGGGVFGTYAHLPLEQGAEQDVFAFGGAAAPSSLHAEPLATGTSDSAPSRAPWANSSPPAPASVDSGSFRRSVALSMDSGSFPRSGGSGSFTLPPVAAPAPASHFEENPDATRVATVPEELLRSSAVLPVSEPAPQRFAAVVPPAAVDPDETHFQETFQDFIATRERCGEPGDNVPYERFAAKLRKNREQLVQKYACRTVRFQVYVKDGKAALKATPVKD